MLTVQEVARRTGRNPETIRRWIRDGKLRAEKVGTRHLVNERDLDAAIHRPRSLPMPEAWRTLPSGARPPIGLRPFTRHARPVTLVVDASVAVSASAVEEGLRALGEGDLVAPP